MLILKYISLIFGSFFIFIYSLTKLRTLLSEKANNKLKYYIKKYTDSYHISFFLGIIITILLTSSTALTVITIAFLSSNLIKEKSAFAIILGANIGTSLTAFLFSFDISSFSFLIIILGLFLKLIKKDFLSIFFILLGIIFYSLSIIELSIEALSENITFLFPDSLLLVLLEGILISIILNSSSTTIITASMMYVSNTITLVQGITIMLGANIGTTITSYFYTFNQSKNTKKIIKYNIIFNILGALLFLCFIDYFIKMLELLNILNYNSQAISLSHFIFNLLTTFIIYIIFIPINSLFTDNFS